MKLQFAIILITVFIMGRGTNLLALTCARVYSLADIQRIAKDGVTIVVPIENPYSVKRLATEKKMYGALVTHVITGKKRNPKATQTFPGVVIHLSEDADDEEILYSSVHGALDLTRDNRKVTKRLIDQKWREYKFVQSVQPGAMPRSVNLADLIQNRGGDNFVQLHENALSEVSQYMLSRSREVSDRSRESIVKLVQLILDISREEFPDGAFIKNVAEVQTGDRDDMITTFKSSADVIADKFIRSLQKVKYSQTKRSRNFTSKGVNQELLLLDSSSTHFVLGILLSPETVMIQEKFEMGTLGGEPLEVRVNFAQGIAINAAPRYSYAYIPEHLNRAMEFINGFFKRLPDSKRRVTGAADIMFGKDGSPILKTIERKSKRKSKRKINELNIGSRGGSIYARMEAIMANDYISVILGRPTELFQFLEKIYQSGLEGQKKFIAPRKTKYNDSKLTFYDLSVQEVSNWLKDRYLVEWQKNPTSVNAQTCLTSLRSLLTHSDPRVQLELDNMYYWAERYISAYIATGGHPGF